MLGLCFCLLFGTIAPNIKNNDDLLLQRIQIIDEKGNGIFGSFAIYLDKELQKPYELYDLPVVLHSDEQGKIDISLPHGNYFLQQIYTTNGYTMIKEPIALTFNEQMSQQDIVVKNPKLEYQITWQKQQEDLVVQIVDEQGKWISTIEQDHPFIENLETEHTYQIQVLPTQQYSYSIDDPILVVDQPKKQIELAIQKYKTIQVNTYDQQEKVFAKYVLYEDASLTTLAKDYRQKTLTGEQDSFQVLPGTYYLKQTKIDQDYELNQQVIELHVREEDGRLIQTHFMAQPKTMTIQVEKKKDEPITLQIRKQSGEIIKEWTTTNSDTKIDLSALPNEPVIIQEKSAYGSSSHQNYPIQKGKQVVQIVKSHKQNSLMAWVSLFTLFVIGIGFWLLFKKKQLRK